MATYSLGQSLTSVRGAIPEPGLVGNRSKEWKGSPGAHPSWAMVASPSNRRNEVAKLCSQAGARSRITLVSQFWSMESRRDLLMKMNKCDNFAPMLRPGSHLVVVREVPLVQLQFNRLLIVDLLIWKLRHLEGLICNVAPGFLKRTA